MADLLTDLADLFNYEEYEGDLDEKSYGLAIMMLLQDFCKKYNSKSYNYIVKHFDDDCKKLEDKLLKENNKQFEKYEQATIRKELLSQDIPQNKHKDVNLKYDVKITKKVVETTIKNTIQALRDEIKLNIQVVTDRNDEDSFNLAPKLRDTVKRIKRAVSYGANVQVQKIRRASYEYHYGENAKYYWVTKGDDRVCAWCRQQEKEPPRKMADWELDHPHGRCSFRPSNAEATDDYVMVVEGGHR